MWILPIWKSNWVTESGLIIQEEIFIFLDQQCALEEKMSAATNSQNSDRHTERDIAGRMEKYVKP